MPGPGIVAELLSGEEMRETLAGPRMVPRAVREYLAETIARDLVMGEDYLSYDPVRIARRLGPLYQLFVAARYTEEWSALRQIASACPAMAPVCVRNSLVALLDAFEASATDEARIDGSRDLAAFTWLIRDTLVLWGRKPGEGSTPAHCPEASGDGRLMDDLAQRAYVPRIRPFLDRIAESEDAMELFALLYPGRMWDRGMAGLHQEHVGSIRLYSGIAARSGELREVLDMIGRTSEDEGPGTRAVAARSRSELHSVVNSKDLQYLLPMELVKLQDPTLKYLFMARWAEGNLLTYHLTGRSRSRKGLKRRKGPVVALVDTSGSMSGSPGLLAKALVLAAAKRALGAGRDMRVVLFSSTGQTRAIDLTGTRKDPDAFLDFLQYTFGGGTDFDTALRSGLDALKEHRYGSADLLFITDGLAKLTDRRLLTEWDRFKAENRAQIYTIIVGNDRAGGLEEISDRTFRLEAGPGLEADMKLTSV